MSGVSVTAGGFPAAVGSCCRLVFTEFTSVPQLAAGRHSQLVVASQDLRATERGDNLELEVPLRERIARLLD